MDPRVEEQLAMNGITTDNMEANAARANKEKEILNKTRNVLQKPHGQHQAENNQKHLPPINADIEQQLQNAIMISEVIEESQRHSVAAMAASRVMSGSKEPTTELEQAELDRDLAQISAFEKDTKLREALAECENLQKQVLALKRDLADTQDFVFSLQPRQARITAQDATTEYSSLCDAVEEWVQTNLGDAIFDKALLKEQIPLNQSAKKFLNLISHAGHDAFVIPETDEFNVIAAVIVFLQSEIFNLDFYCPLEQGAMDFLKSLEKTLEHIEPRLDLAAQRSWRCDTFTAVVNRPKFGMLRKRRSDELTQRLTGLLRIFLPPPERHKLSTIRSAIIEPALALAQKLHLSVDRFSWESTPFSKTPPEQRPTMPGKFAKFECADFRRNGRIMKIPEGNNVPSTGPPRITYIMDIRPALLFEEMKTETFAEPRVLKPAKILVAGTREGEHLLETRHIIGKSPTLLGCMDDIVHRRLPGRNGIFS